MPPLDQARVTTIKSGSLLVVGLQEARTGRNYETFRQAWWCRVVDGGATGAGRPGGGLSNRCPSHDECVDYTA